MTEIFIPHIAEPLISEQALGQISSDILQNGLFTTGLSAVAMLLDNELLFAEHMADIAKGLTIDSPVNKWPAITLYAGAGLAWKAYRETGYYQSIDYGFSNTNDSTVNKRNPKTYLSSLVLDQSLFLLVDISSESKELEKYVGTDKEENLGIGAGCVRFYLQQAVLSA